MYSVHVRNTLGNFGEVGILREVFSVVGVWIFSGTTIAISVKRSPVILFCSKNQSTSEEYFKYKGFW